MRVLVYGLAVAGAATVRALQRRGHDVVVVDDVITSEREALAGDLGVDLLGAPSEDELTKLVRAVDLVLPAPGVPETHRLFAIAAAADTPVASELELAYRWEQERPGGPRPMLAVTGTDGKTTTTLLTVAMLNAGGVSAIDAGNTDVPLVEALDLDVDAFVVECSSFRLAWTERFRADAAAWTNLSPDHLNWHRDLASYEASKGRIFAQQRSDDAAIGFTADPVVMAHLGAAPGRRRTFGPSTAEHPSPDYRVVGTGDDAVLTAPAGDLTSVGAMRRHLPHDVTNSLAAAALVLETGLVEPAAVAGALASFEGPPHRIELVGEAAGIRWFNDSKATTPHAAAAAIRGFDHVVLIAGGSDKGVDLSGLAAEPHRIRAVIAIGETAPLIAAVFTGIAPVDTVASMSDAVERAAAAARPGDVVLLSPACASFDWYRNYGERGDDFRRLVAAMTFPGHAGRADSSERGPS